MAIPTNEWYTIKSGDTLSKIAKEAGISDWRTIYNDPQNADFRKKRPDPDKIYPGDEIWIPGNPKTSTGKKTVFVVPVEKIQVTEIYFDSQVDIHYVRLAASHSDYIAPGVPSIPGYLYPKPKSTPKVYPEAGMPHWIFDAVSSQPTESWPTVLIRDGSKAATGAKRKLQVSFSVSVPFDGDRIIKAESESGELLIGEQSVTFKKGTVVKAPFTFTRVPSTVDKLSGVKLKWFVKKGTSGSFTETCQTQHTFFIIDKKPQMANLVINWSHLDIYLFELFDWSCSWAKGKTGTKDILAGIWSQFYPARQVHATNLVYWKIRNARLLPQSIIDAILSQDDPNPNRQNGASCIVFDRILINCLGIQGIKAAEIMIHVSADSSNGFPYAGSTYSCKSFNASTVKAQGNFNAPSTWLSHWIADVYDDSSNNSSSYTIKSGDTLSKIAKQAGITDWRTIYNDPQNADFRKKRPDPDKIYPGDTIWIPDPSNAKTSAKWKIYDASYGVAAYDSNDPNVNDPVDVFSYEKVAVKDFSCTEKTTLNPLDIPPGATPTEPPHLTGDVLWTP